MVLLESEHLRGRLVNDDLLAHEPIKPFAVELRLTRRNHLSIPLVEPHLNIVLTPLLKVVGLQIVNHSYVVDKAAINRNELMSVSRMQKLEILYEFIYGKKGRR